MRPRSKLITAASTAAVLCLGSYSVASATSRPAALSSAQAISACATGNGYLRLAATSDKCASGTAKISLARSSTAPQALALYTTSQGSQLTKTLSLIGDTQLFAYCANGANSVAGLKVVHNGQTQIDGTSFVVENGIAQVAFVRDSGSNVTPTGADSVYSAQAGGFEAFDVHRGGFATGNIHLLVTVPGAVFTIDAVVDANGATPYCRVSAEVESAATDVLPAPGG